MTNRSDIDRVMEVWMADGPNAIPDRVVDVVAARIGVQRQRRTWPFHGRTNVTTPLKLIAGLAAALIVAVVGYSLLPGTTGPGAPTTAPTSTPQPTAAVTAAPSAAARWPTWFPPAAVADANGAGILSAGSHATRVFRPAFTFSAPDGWVNAHDEANFFTLFRDTPANAAEMAQADRLADQIYMGPHGSPWFVCEALEDNGGATAAEMVTALTANEVLAVSGLVDVTIGGLSGKRFDVRANPDWTGTCTGNPDIDLDEYRVRGILLDTTDGRVIVIFVESLYAAGFEAFLAQAMPIIESFQFEQ